jgi:hypothetical protein
MGIRVTIPKLKNLLKVSFFHLVNMVMRFGISGLAEPLREDSTLSVS